MVSEEGKEKLIKGQKDLKKKKEYKSRVCNENN
jgi:hypothetical protein